jgi:hypothetical protein
MKRNLAQLFSPIKYFHFECPQCGSEIEYAAVKIGFRLRYETDYWECTVCKSLLCVSRLYSWSVLLGMLAVALIATWALGIRWWFLFVPGTIVALWIVGMIVGTYLKWLLPPKIRIYVPDDFTLFSRK